MLYFTCPLHEATAEVVDGNGNVTAPATANCPGTGATSPYPEATAVPGSKVYYKGGSPTPGADTVLVVAPAGTAAQSGWVEVTQVQAQTLFPQAGV
jgi:hypothetical protein